MSRIVKYLYKRAPFLLLIGCLVLSGRVWADEGSCDHPNVSGPPIWPPYIMPYGNNQYSGLAFDMAEAVIKPVLGDYQLNFGRPWARVQAELKVAKQDLVLAMLRSPERERSFHFTKAWTHDRYGIVYNPKSPISYKGLDSLAEKKGAFLHGVKLPEPFQGFDLAPSRSGRSKTRVRTDCHRRSLQWLRSRSAPG